MDDWILPIAVTPPLAVRAPLPASVVFGGQGAEAVQDLPEIRGLNTLAAGSTGLGQEKQPARA
jgi:hypothetical protein